MTDKNELAEWGQRLTEQMQYALDVLGNGLRGFEARRESQTGRLGNAGLRTMVT